MIGNCAADQLLCFYFKDSAVPLLPESEISSPWPSFVGVQPDMCQP